MAVGAFSLSWKKYPFRLAALRQSTFPKGTASVVAIKFPAQPKGVPLGELANVVSLRGFLPPVRFLDQGADVVREHLHGGAVLAAVGHNNVRVALAGLYKGLVHRLDRGKVLVDHAV